MFYAHWFTIFTLRMCPGLLVFLFQIICMKHCKPWLKAQLGWKTRTPSHEKKIKIMQFQSLLSFFCQTETVNFQNTFTKIDETHSDKRALLGFKTHRHHCFMIQAQAGLEPGLHINHVDCWLFWAVVLSPLGCGIIRGISALPLAMDKHHSDFAGQMRTFPLSGFY